MFVLIFARNARTGDDVAAALTAAMSLFGEQFTRACGGWSR